MNCQYFIDLNFHWYVWYHTPSKFSDNYVLQILEKNVFSTKIRAQLELLAGDVGVINSVL